MEPSARALLPYLWLAWSDDLLTQTEFQTLQRFIHQQQWIGSDDRKIFSAWADVNSPPSRQQLAEWKSTIYAVLQAKPKTRSLFSLAEALSSASLKPHRAAFEQLEQELGLLGPEALATFRSPAQTLTAQHESINRFYTAKMQRLLDGEQAEIIAKVKALLSQPKFRYTNDRDLDAYRKKVLQWCRVLAKERLGAMGFPKEYGGGGNLPDYFAIMETLSYHDLSLVIKFGVQFGLWGMSVYLLGTEKHHRKYLKDIGSMKIPGCFAMTETGHGSNVKGLETLAYFNAKDRTFTVHTPHPGAQKEYIGNAAAHGKMATVFAKLIVDGNDYGVGALIVPIRDAEGKPIKGVTIGDCGSKMGLNGVDNGTLRFNKVVVPYDNLLDRFASVSAEGVFESPIPSDNRRFFTMLGTLVGGRIGIPRSALSAGKTGLTIAVRYADGRRQFGPDGGSEIPILNYRQHQRRLLPHLAKSYALHFALRYLTDRYLNRNENQMQEIEALAAGLKAYTTWEVRDTLQECREACGGKGYLSENRIDRLKNDTEIYTTFEGDNTVLMQLVAKNRLAEFRKNYGKMDASGVIQYVWEKAKTAVSEKNPIAVRSTDEAHLLDGNFHHQAFVYREKAILESGALRLKKLVDGGLDAYDAFNVAQHHMKAIAESFLERVVLEQFQRAVKETKVAKCRTALERLCCLFALSTIEKNAAWYLESGYIEGVKSKAIRKTVNQLCWEIRPDAVALVDAFGIPDALLAAPIAKT